MNLRSIREEDLVRCNRGGRLFWGRVEKRLERALAITPLSRNVNYFRVTSREVSAHYALRRPRSGKVSRRSVRPEDVVSYENGGGCVIAEVRALTRPGRLWVRPVAPKAESHEVAIAELTAHYSLARHRTSTVARP